jgi:hypothetical protein
MRGIGTQYVLMNFIIVPSQGVEPAPNQEAGTVSFSDSGFSSTGPELSAMLSLPFWAPWITVEEIPVN